MAQVMQLIRATDDDNARMLEYFSQSTIPGSIEIRPQRMFNFFNHYKIQSDDYTTCLLTSQDDRIEALATLLFRPGLVDGNPETIGYATDLRVSPTRRAVLGWSQHFLPVLEAERQARQCRYVFSTVPHSQRQAYNAFIRPRHLRREFPRYHLFRRLQLVSLHGLWPFHDLPLTGIKIRSAVEADRAPLADYIIRKAAGRPLNWYFTPEDFDRSLARWNDFNLENFLIAFDSKKNIIGCVAPWSPERVQRLYTGKYDSKAQNFQDLLKFMSWFRLAHPLPGEDRQLEYRHLTHLYADNPDIFYSLLYNAFEMAGKKEFLVYPHFDGELLTLPPKSFVSAETPYGLYCVLSPNDPIPDFLKPRTMQPPPVFEPAFM